MPAQPMHGVYANINMSAPAAAAWNPYPANMWNMPPTSQHAWNIAMRADRRPIDAKPADDDPWRFYTVKEIDGGITSRNRYTIDNYLQPIKWVMNFDGTWVAVRLRKE
jgi:hypothetical protein